MQSKMDTKSPATAVKCWVELYSDNLYSWALHKTSSKETAEDLVQETFLAAVRSFNRFNGDSDPKTWLFSILNNKISDYYRTMYRQPVLDENVIFERLFDQNGQWKAEETPRNWTDVSSHLLDNKEFLVVLNQCMAKLPGKWYSAVQLNYMEEKKGKEICKELEISPTNFWQIMHRAKLQLRKCLELNWFKK